MNIERIFLQLSLASWVLFFAYISLVPFYYLQPVQLEFNQSTITFLKYLPFFSILLLSFLALLGHFLHLFRFQNTPIDLYVGGFLTICLVSLVDAVYPAIGLWKVLYYTATGIYLPYLMLNLIKSERDLHLIIDWVTNISALVTLYGLTVYLVGVDYIWGELYVLNNPYYSSIGRMASTLGNASYVGGYLALCLPYFLWRLETETRPYVRLLCKGLIIAVLMGVGLTFTRGAWLAAMIAGGIYCIPHMRSIISCVKARVSIQRFYIATILLFLAIPILEGIGFREPMHSGWNRLWERVDQTFHFSDTESYRLSQYYTTWRVLKAHPFFGLGFGNFTRQYDQYKHPDTPLTGTTTTENIYLMITCETGIIGVVLFCFLLFKILKIVYLSYKTIPAGSAKMLLLASLSSMIGFVINMATWDALNQPTVRMTFWMVAGFALCQLKLHAGKRET